MRNICIAILLLALGAGAALAQPFAVPFSLDVGKFVHLDITYDHRDILAGTALPEVVARCSLRMSVDRADKGGAVVLVHHEKTDLTVGDERGPAPADLRSLMLLAIATQVARVELDVSGAPLRVTNWGLLRDAIATRARELAGGNAALAGLAADYLAGLDDHSAVMLLAEPLALAAAGRSVTFDLPDETLVVRGSLALPSFLPATWSEWAFQFAGDPPSPDVVTIAWEGVASRAALDPLLPAIAEGIGALGTSPAPDLAEQAASARQLFRADYARDDGRLIALTGTLTLTAGPLVRTESVEIKVMR